MNRKRNGVEIKSVSPDAVLVPLFPVQNPHPQINYSEVDGEELAKRGNWRRRGALLPLGSRITLEELVKFHCETYFSNLKSK